MTRADIHREAKLRASPLEHRHSNESCDCPCGHEQTCEGCGFHGAEGERS
jgi:hypothetical protein